MSQHSDDFGDTPIDRGSPEILRRAIGPGKGIIRHGAKSNALEICCFRRSRDGGSSRDLLCCSCHGLGLGVHRKSVFGFLVFHCPTGGRIRDTDGILHLPSKRGPGNGHVGKSCRRVGDDLNCCDDFLLRALPDQHPPSARRRGGDRFGGAIPDRIILVRIGVQFSRDYLYGKQGRQIFARPCNVVGTKHFNG